MTKETLKDICAIGGPILALLGFLYGYAKDKKLRNIERRANSPFFTVLTVQLDCGQVSIPQGGKAYYHYREKPSGLIDHLWDMEEYEPHVPENYPNDYPIGLLLKNTGSSLRTFKFKSREQMVFQQADDKNLYELRYIYHKSSAGDGFRFTLSYETSEGFQETQVWEVIKGEISIKRIKPKTP